MLDRMIIKDGERPESARKRLDAQLRVSEWPSPGLKPKPRDSDAPWWWDGAEDASQSFLKAMGVNL